MKDTIWFKTLNEGKMAWLEIKMNPETWEKAEREAMLLSVEHGYPYPRARRLEIEDDFFPTTEHLFMTGPPQDVFLKILGRIGSGYSVD